jgi:hypothetical protein
VEDKYVLHLKFNPPLECEDMMHAYSTNSMIPLLHAVLCLDCSCVSDGNRACPACSSTALMNLSTVLNRRAVLSHPAANAAV